MAWTVLALGCHPDDIEFMMSGTLFLLKERGADIHCMITANGNCGSLRYGAEELARIRREEAKRIRERPGPTNTLHVHSSRRAFRVRS